MNLYCIIFGLIFLAAGALLIAVGIYTGVIDAPAGLLALPFFAI